MKLKLVLPTFLVILCICMCTVLTPKKAMAADQCGSLFGEDMVFSELDQEFIKQIERIRKDNEKFAQLSQMMRINSVMQNMDVTQDMGSEMQLIAGELANVLLVQFPFRQLLTEEVAVSRAQDSYQNLLNSKDKFKENNLYQTNLKIVYQMIDHYRTGQFQNVDFEVRLERLGSLLRADARADQLASKNMGDLSRLATAILKDPSKDLKKMLDEALGPVKTSKSEVNQVPIDAKVKTIDSIRYDSKLVYAHKNEVILRQLMNHENLRSYDRPLKEKITSDLLTDSYSEIKTEDLIFENILIFKAQNGKQNVRAKRLSETANVFSFAEKLKAKAELDSKVIDVYNRIDQYRSASESYLARLSSPEVIAERIHMLLAADMRFTMINDEQKQKELESQMMDPKNNFLSAKQIADKVFRELKI